MKKRTLVTLLSLFALILAGCGTNGDSGSSSIIESSVSSEPVESSEPEPVLDSRFSLAPENFDANVRELQQKNKDTVGWITIEGTETAYPVMQSEDNDYYLRLNFDQEYDVFGIPYLDFKNTPAMTDQNSVIYAHMTYGTGPIQFGSIRFFEDQDYVDQSPKTVTVTTNTGIYTYRMVSLREVAADAPYRHESYPGDEYVAFLKEALDHSMVDFGYTGEITTGDRVLTLSTCTPQDDESLRLALVCVLEKAELTPEAYQAEEQRALQLGEVTVVQPAR